MDLLIVPVPLFDENIAVQAYYFRSRKGNDLLDGTGTSYLDGAMISPPFEVLNMVRLEALTMSKPIFVPLNKYMLLSNLETRNEHPADKIIFLIDGSELGDVGPYVDNIKRLKGLGYRFGIQKVARAEDFFPVIEHCDYIFYDHQLFEQKNEIKTRLMINNRFKGITSIYTHINTMDLFKELNSRYVGLFEGHFYRTPVTRGVHEVSPLQVNLISLLNMVHDESFEFETVSEVVGKDPALTISLLNLVNSAYFALKEKVKSINQAVVMLGQKEVRRWITTAVAKLLGAEKPNELTRLALIRAKFTESLAEKFGLAGEAQSLFLMGLFSLLDAMLDMPIDQALRKVRVSDEIYEALTEQGGPYGAVYNFVLEYEAANWNLISRLMILNDLQTDEIFDAYIAAIGWYDDLLKTEA